MAKSYEMRYRHPNCLYPHYVFCVFIGISIRKSEETVDEIDHYIFLSDIVAKMVP